MLIPVSRLTPTDLAAVRALEARVIAHDGGRLKLELETLQELTTDDVHALLWWEDAQLVGFLGLYAFGGPTVELAGMVDPAARRQGIGSALLERALALGAERGFTRALIVASPAGRAFAQSKDAELSHSEHYLVLGPTPTGPPEDPAVTYRQAELADVPEVARLLAAAFGETVGDVATRLQTRLESTLVVERAGAPVGTARLSRHEGAGAVYGFAVDPAVQGQGIGRDVLARFCRQLREEGYDRVTLEVEVDNEHALGLYLSTGFVREATEEYWALEGDALRT